MICLQSVCFGSYLFANILLYLEIAFYSTNENPDAHQQEVLMCVWILATFLSFVTQCSLILIFLEIGKKNPLKRQEDERITMMTGPSGERTTSYKTFKMTFKEAPESALKYSNDDSRSTLLNENEDEEPTPEHMRDKTTAEDVGMTEEMRLTVALNDNLQEKMHDEFMTGIVQQFWKQDARKTAAFVKTRFQTISANSSGGSH